MKDNQVYGEQERSHTPDNPTHSYREACREEVLWVAPKLLEENQLRPIEYVNRCTRALRKPLYHRRLEVILTNRGKHLGLVHAPSISSAEESTLEYLVECRPRLQIYLKTCSNEFRSVAESSTSIFLFAILLLTITATLVQSDRSVGKWRL